MAQYLLDASFMSKLKEIYLANIATAICFCKPTFAKGSLGPKLICSYYKFKEVGGYTNLKPVSEDGRSESAYPDISADIDLYNKTPVGKGFSYSIDGLEIKAIRGTGEFKPLPTLPSGSTAPSILPIPSSAVPFGLVYFKIEDLLSISEDVVYLTTSSMKFNNLVPSSSGSGPSYNHHADFTTLFATAEITFTIQKDNLDNLRYASGKPCPPFWSPRTSLVFNPQVFNDSIIFENASLVSNMSRLIKFHSRKLWKR